MGTISRGIRLGRQVVALVAIALLTFTMGSCAKPVQPTELISEPTPQPNRLTGQIAEVSPPATLETLKQIIDAYTPQVRLLSPRPGEVLDDTSVAVRFQVRGLPLFKDDTYQLGPHLHLFLDNEPYKAVYDLSEPVTFADLSPGTHTLRVFASRPWHESFKNQGAFDQRTFHVIAPTPQNELDASTPLLTYSRPQGSYGAEPIMLDFYLTNAPLHMSAQAEPNDDLHDWRIRCTVNDQSFVFDQWQPIWLKGFKPGRNWVQLELIDESGTPIDNRFNNTVRIIDYQPGGSDTLSRLVRGEVTLNDIAGIIDPTYEPPTPPEPEPIGKAEAEEDGSEDSAAAEALEQPSANGGDSVVPDELVAPAPTPDRSEVSLPAPEGTIEGSGDRSGAADTDPNTEVQPPPLPQPDSSLEPAAAPESAPQESAAPESQDNFELEDDVAETTDLSEDANASAAAARPDTVSEAASEELTAPAGDKLSAETATPDLPEAGPEMTEPSLTEPSLAMPRSPAAESQESLPAPEPKPAEEPDDLDEPESVDLPGSDRPQVTPRSPLAPEVRPFI
ncbi:hypothetical protein IQ254_15615 [Nodosilinea sp. LEGE 07088]|uniref:hypothetical protein n=1 Tax=Nodosilinea sp. LEGE 07088 TaxID=2777968 RepID=UPI0018819229|nr:hypothetical protein [Nodosilinea sp. LEGE 07088]MBE9138601.1 hypothetical protein [Nodosilinea sp. LEGE 07088]